MDLTNASAIVTGGAGGFGSATVRKLAQKGAKVVIADVSDERGAGQGGRRRLPLRADRLHGRRRHRHGGQGGRRPRAAARRRDHPHRPGLARMLDPGGVRHPLAKFAHVINVYLNSASAVTSQGAEEMAKNEPLASNQRGVIINTASIEGFEGQPGQAA
jgi:NAD(P)-dependent dehydrogenase (short-subunit alcohol dehydrogenase family)